MRNYIDCLSCENSFSKDKDNCECHELYCVEKEVVVNENDFYELHN